MGTYKFSAWIHPIEGGDDYEAEVTINAGTLKGAKHHLEKWLKKQSAITTDYRLISET
jgi:hypothetical protein